MIMATVAAVMALCAGAPVAGAAAVHDPVLDAINSASRRGKITGSERAHYRSTWRASARAARSLGGARGNAVACVRRDVTLVAHRGALTASRLEGVMASVRATTYVMRHRSYPSFGDRIHLPFDPAVFGYYPGHGVQLQPLYTFSHGNTLVAQGRTDDVRALADRMAAISSVRGGYRTWEYGFDWQGSPAPWNSAMAQATAVQFYARAWQLTSEPTYRGIVREAMPGFSRPAWKDGLSVREGDGRWFLLYPDHPHQRILNGHLQVLLGLLDVGSITGDRRAAGLVAAGTTAVLPLLPRFDTGAWSRYSYGKEATLEYHDLMTGQLRKLGNRTGRARFAALGERFAAYRITPPQVAAIPNAVDVLYPVSDGFHDVAPMRFRVDKQSRVRISVVNAAGAPLRTWRLHASRGWHRVVWNGRTGSGRMARAGSYGVDIRAIDVAGNVSNSSRTGIFTVREDTTPPQLVRASIRSAGQQASILRITVRDRESPWVVVRVVVMNHVIAQRRITGRGNIRLPRRTGQLRRGVMLLTDSSGNRTRVRI